MGEEGRAAPRRVAPRAAARLMTLADDAPAADPFLMRALRAAQALIANGHFVRAELAPLPACFACRPLAFAAAPKRSRYS